MAAKTLRCVVVTPECAVLDETADSIVMPLFDGESGVLPGREPLMGKLRSGELRLTGAKTRSLFVDGGFVQVVRDTVTILTPRALTPSQIDQAAAQKTLEAPSAPGISTAAMEERQASISKASAQLKVARSR
ncbi:MAG: ATP synthase F1 subunit epsilon [Planctomycetota bacterium]|nr:ATP synthase F1 subunit epsilon [Planctomycetota bacterium]